MHADQILYLKRHHDGQIPNSWLTGDTDYRKAAVLAAVAWFEVKSSDEPQLKDCDISFREQCIGIAESIIQGSKPDDTLFAQHAAALWATTLIPTEEALT